MKEKFIIEKARTGKPTVIFQKEEIKLYLHSRYDPEKESDTLITQKLKSKKKLIILLGCGLGYPVISIFKLNLADKVVVIVKNLELLNYGKNFLALDKFLSLNKLIILSNDEINKIYEIIKQIKKEEIGIIIYPAEYKIYREFYSNIKRILDSFLSRKDINIATLSRFQKTWIKNIFKNLKKFLSSPGVNIFFNRFNNLPGLVISAGPSLNSQLDIIRENQNKFIIFAVDSVFKTLLLNNIIPDFVVSVDPQFLNFKNFEYVNNYTSILVTEPTSFYLNSLTYKGRVIYFTSLFKIVKWFEEFTEKKGELELSGSVSTATFDFAIKTGCNPVILAGQDFGYIDNLTHIKGSVSEKYHLQRLNRFKNFHLSLFKITHSPICFKIKNNKGKDIITDKRFHIFYTWFEKKIKNTKAEVINVSQDGAYIPGTVVKNIKDITYTLKDISETKTWIKTFKLPCIKTNYEGLIKSCREIQKKLKQIVSLSEQGIYYSRRLYKEIKSNKDFNSTLKLLDKIDKEIKKETEITEFISIAIQERIHIILNEYEKRLNKGEKEDNRLKIARRSQFLYEGIKESAEIFYKFINIYVK